MRTLATGMKTPLVNNPANGVNYPLVAMGFVLLIVFVIILIYEMTKQNTSLLVFPIMTIVCDVCVMIMATMIIPSPEASQSLDVTQIEKHYNITMLSINYSTASTSTCRDINYLDNQCDITRDAPSTKPVQFIDANGTRKLGTLVVGDTHTTLWMGDMNKTEYTSPTKTSIKQARHSVPIKQNSELPPASIQATIFEALFAAALIFQNLTAIIINRHSTNDPWNIKHEGLIEMTIATSMSAVLITAFLLGSSCNQTHQDMTKAIEKSYGISQIDDATDCPNKCDTIKRHLPSDTEYNTLDDDSDALKHDATMIRFVDKTNKPHYGVVLARYGKSTLYVPNGSKLIEYQPE